MTNLLIGLLIGSFLFMLIFAFLLKYQYKTNPDKFRGSLYRCNHCGSKFFLIRINPLSVYCLRCKNPTFTHKNGWYPL